MLASHQRGLVAIGCFKLLKATALAVVGLGLLSLVHRDVGAVVETWVESLRIDPGNHLFHGFLEKVTGIPSGKLAELGVGTLFYAAVFATEGVGLLFAKQWAEYLTLGVTISFLPLEIYEIARHGSVMKALVVALNVAVVLYLWRHVRRGRSR
jgi:uncharacterized membrane protein (DUF2068 family)